MKFGVFYELQLPRPWKEGAEHELFNNALDQVVLADEIGIDHAWAVEHHFLEEYSHCSAPEVFLAAAAARTSRIRVGHGIRQVIANYNHPVRTAECIASLDLISNGRVDFGIGEGATRLELHAFDIPAREKRAMSLEAAEQIANMMVMTPYPGYEGKSFSLPARNVLPKPLQKPHPPMWIACTNRDTIKLAAQNGLGALAFSFVDPEEAHKWSEIYYDIIKSEQCVPLGHSVNANIAIVSSFSMHRDRATAIRQGQEGFEFFGYALRRLVTEDTIPGYTTHFEEFLKTRGNRTEEMIAELNNQSEGMERSAGIGTPDDFRNHVNALENAGIDQVILLQQAGNNTHEQICSSLNLFAEEVLPEFKAKVEEKEAKKARELAPYIEAALERKDKMPTLSKDNVPLVKASVDMDTFNKRRYASRRKTD